MAKPTMVLMGEVGSREFAGSAFVNFGRLAGDPFSAQMEANPGPPPPGFMGKGRDAVQ